jgi:S1-C subfamily serine protease
VGPVPSGSTAAAAGLHEGDRITAIDGAPVTPAALQKAAKAFHTGGQLTLGLRRKDGQTETLEIEFEVEEQGAATK